MRFTGEAKHRYEDESRNKVEIGRLQEKQNRYMRIRGESRLKCEDHRRSKDMWIRGEVG
jgi:hypothetical protein